jgi:hypothetical protein
VHLGRNWPARSKTRVGTYGSSGWWWPAHSVTIGGEGGGESGLGHEGVAGIPIEAKTGQRLRQRGTVAEAWGRGRCNRRVGREATLGCPGSCRGRSGADSVEGGPSAWRCSHGEEDSFHGTTFGTMTQCNRWSKGRARVVQQRRGVVVLVAEVGGGRVMMRQHDVTGALLLPTGGDSRRAKLRQWWRYSQGSGEWGWHL